MFLQVYELLLRKHDRAHAQQNDRATNNALAPPDATTSAARLAHGCSTGLEYYTIGPAIGQGAFGSVNLAWHRVTGAAVAVKTYGSSFWKKDPTMLAQVCHTCVL